MYGDARRTESSKQDGDEHNVGRLSRGSENTGGIFESRAFKIDQNHIRLTFACRVTLNVNKKY